MKVFPSEMILNPAQSAHHHFQFYIFHFPFAQHQLRRKSQFTFPGPKVLPFLGLIFLAAAFIV
jgi:hypothetical protein